VAAMRKHNSASCIVAVGAILSLSRIAAAGVQANGNFLHGIGPDGKTVNGKTVNGTSLNGLQVSGVQVNGQTLSGALTNVQLNGTMLTGVLNGVSVTAAQLTGAQLTAQMIDANSSTPVPVTLRIDSVAPPPFEVATTHCHSSTPRCTPQQLYDDTCDTTPVTTCNTTMINQPSAGPNYDVNLYVIEYLDASNTWQPMCPYTTSTGATNNFATLLAGAWESRVSSTTTPYFTDGTFRWVGGTLIPGTTSSAFTFACHQHGALAKCAEMGYKPWSTTQSSWATDLLQACVRMIRADYCGDGNSHTMNGTSIDVADWRSIQVPDPNDTYANVSKDPTDYPGGVPYGPEAEWNPDGAACISNLRWQGLEPSPAVQSSMGFGGGAVTLGQVLAAECPNRAATISTCLGSYTTYVNGGAFSEPTFAAPVDTLPAAQMLDFSCSIGPNGTTGVCPGM
jgi:hypothetical protein